MVFKLIEDLVPLFEPVTGPLSIVYANGEEWEDRRKWLYESLKGTSLESYMPMFIKVRVFMRHITIPSSAHPVIKIKTISTNNHRY